MMMIKARTAAGRTMTALITKKSPAEAVVEVIMTPAAQLMRRAAVLLGVGPGGATGATTAPAARSQPSCSGSGAVRL